PAQRYQKAEWLAEDLRRYLEDRPLQYAPELSKAERVKKFVRRHPRAVQTGGAVAAAAVLLAVSGAVVAVTRARLDVAEQRAREGEKAEARELMRRVGEGTERARCLVNTTSGTLDQVTEGLAVCDRTLAAYLVLSRLDWQQHPAFQRLEPEHQCQV